MPAKKKTAELPWANFDWEMYIGFTLMDLFFKLEGFLFICLWKFQVSLRIIQVLQLKDNK